MHFVIGGAYNGKRQWVMTELVSGRPLLETISPISAADLSLYKMVVWSDMERWIETSCSEGIDETQILNSWRNEVNSLIQWETKDEGHQVVIIGTDQSKGIVPMDQTKRIVRDLAGWCHQYTAQKAERVTRVWYGIPEEIKMKEEQS